MPEDRIQVSRYEQDFDGWALDQALEHFGEIAAASEAREARAASEAREARLGRGFEMDEVLGSWLPDRSRTSLVSPGSGG